jgi:hypothetical protein
MARCSTSCSSIADVADRSPLAGWTSKSLDAPVTMAVRPDRSASMGMVHLLALRRNVPA